MPLQQDSRREAPADREAQVGRPAGTAHADVARPDAADDADGFYLVGREGVGEGERVGAAAGDALVGVSVRGFCLRCG